MKIDYEGEVSLIVINVRTGEVVQRHKQKNLFLNVGRQKVLYKCGSSGCYCRIILSDSTAAESVTDTAVPATVVYGSSEGLSSINETEGLSCTRRWTVTISPGTPRVINTVGLANDASGANAICYTKLTTTVNQGIDDSVSVFYSLTISTY